jgi:hypothetical protein
MRKLMLVAAVLAMAIVAVVPALAQVGQESDQEVDSGDVDQSFTVTGGGDNSNQCASIQGTANTGNSQNQIDTIQYASEGDFEFDETGSTLTVNPVNTTDCTQAVNQAASASG